MAKVSSVCPPENSQPAFGKPLTGMIASVLARDTVGTLGRCGGGGVHQLLKGFARSERGNRFRRDRDRISGTWIAAFPRRAVPEPEAHGSLIFPGVSQILIY